MLTRDLIHTLCSKLDHEDKSTLIIKKLVQENWLEKVEDLHYVPRSRLERWEVPLKLVDEIYDFVIEQEANAFSNGVSAWVNYSLRPTIDHYMSGPIASNIEWLRDDAEKRNNPDVWAAKRMQRWYRRRKRRRLQEKDSQLMTLALMEANDSSEFSRLDDKENYRRRRERAMVKIRIAVRAWVTRLREKKRRGQATSSKGRGKGKDDGAKQNSQSADTGCPGLAVLLLRHSEGKAKDCEVRRLLLKVFQVVKHGEEDKNLIFLHRLVTQNWIEEMDDLELIEDKHYEEWQFPEKVVVLLKQELREHREKNGLNIGERARDVGSCAATGAMELYTWGQNLIFGDPEDNDSESGTLSPGGKAAPKSRTRRL